ncbi:Acyl-CoA synthetase (AMP-forming)/AMP-acid ligase II [Lutimaribacter pacificus]|uniref:Acyl-CoA synthetase (AMP-forming)/AMP-acid ligase II n=1 Tax=Lutimaribacter pacificus TaxID=391948 RepID=A0A1H0A8G6_9RHOB|nr:class I adenylate-forming enzyme family protein [Lutimaribacter pacificus]SDN30022.1 Acyl-CoA synthetase (AMP-forming)/AMP-acid ligase II [Lutimaribacter pacificus]SHJ71961.1 Acyl-CoA synthetase (AMP-forming)/AMP-acid ligase II [Lutimaribacter pacificus]
MLSVFDTGAPAPCPAPFNMAAHVLAHAGDLPDKIALAVLSPAGADRWSYARLAAAVRGTGTGLLQAGFAPGDILLMRLGNTVEFPIAYLGAIAVGMVPVPTSSQLTAPEVDRMIAGLKPAGILRDAGVPCPDDPGVPVIGTDALEDMRSLPPCDYAMGDPDRLAYIVYTSGTSGVPRAVCHAHRAIWARRMMHEGWYGLGQDDRLLHAGAFNWTFTLGTGLMDPWSVGATALIPARGVGPDTLPLLLKRHDATLFAAAPGVYRKILNHHDRIDLPKLRHGLAAGEKLSDSIRRHWNDATGTRIYEAYGMSECSTFISGSPAHPSRAGMLGQPQDGRRVAIVDADGQPVAMGTEGTIAVGTADPGLMLGYLGAETDTAARIRGEWFLTGDQGHMEEDGQIAYHGRNDDMMNAGGYCVSPLEVEAALLAHPGITEAGATDIEVKEDVRLIAAFYTGPADIPADELAAWCAERLARYKQPRIFRRLDALPTNPNGKLQRQALKALV